MKHRSTFLLSFWSILCIAVGLIGLVKPTICHADQAQRKEEEKVGKETADQIAKTEKFVTDKKVTDRVQAIGAKIAAIASKQKVPAGFGTDEVYPFAYTFHVIDKKDINAFSLPGGYIYIYKGLLDRLKTDDEIAAVLGHECAHAAHHHDSALQHEQNKMNSQLALGALAAVIAHVPLNDLGSLVSGAEYTQQAQLNNRYSEAAEEDADHTGMIYMQRAGYNPVGVLALLLTLKQVEDLSPDVELGYLRDHPLTGQRLAAARAELATLGVTPDAANMRAANGLLIAQATTTKDSSLVSLGDKPVFTVAPTSSIDAQNAASRLNKLLDRNLQGYEVKAVGPDLVVRDQTLIEFKTDDIKVQPASVQSPDEIATGAAKAIKILLWNQSVTTPSENDSPVAETIKDPAE